ncbi:MAG: hypothetical protein ACOZCO_05715, partial [Bacteroidota bacterium]
MSKAVSIARKQEQTAEPRSAQTEQGYQPVPPQEEKKDSWKSTVLYGALAVGVTGLTIWAVRKMVQD